MKKVRKVVSALLAVLMLTSMMAGCSSSAQTAATAAAAPAGDSAAAPAATAAAGEEDKVIRVGVICAMTGGSAIYGEGAQNAVDMAVEEINASDSEYKIEIVNYIRKEFKVSVLLIEHDMSLVMKICERIQVLDFGTTIASGTPEEIANNKKVIEAYLGKDKTAQEVAKNA